MANFKDESFVQQFLSPKMIREFKLFSILDDDHKKDLEVTAIHDEHGYRVVREKLSQQYNLSMNEPNIQIYNVDIRGDRSLTLRHIQHNRRPLEKDNAVDVLKHLRNLWGFDVHLESHQQGAGSETYHCTEERINLDTPETDT